MYVVPCLGRKEQEKEEIINAGQLINNKGIYVCTYVGNTV